MSTHWHWAKSWLRLVRAPNVPTAVADVIAGGALAAVPMASRDLWGAALGSACLYAGGVALNDAFDVEKDRRLHPERVLPSGLVSVGAAKAAGIVLLAAGVASGIPQGTAGILTALVLATAILLYDVLPDGAGVAGAALLGLCRALNLARGGLVAPEFPGDLVAFAAFHFALVACLTTVSLGEDRTGGPRLVRAGLAILPFCYAGPAIAAYRSGHPAWSVVVLIIAAELALWVVRPAHREPRSESAVVPRAVFTLPLLGALYCAAVMEWTGAAILVGLFAVSRLLARALSQRGS